MYVTPADEYGWMDEYHRVVVYVVDLEDPLNLLWETEMCFGRRGF
jgi:hypothetical protein